MAIDAKIRQTIQGNGNIKIDEMMQEVLSQHSDSYYKTIESIGESGDFITAPEISQMFGEIIALWAIEKWQNLGMPKDFILLELGPGQGTLMKDLLRTSKLVPEFFTNAKLYFHEINDFFKLKQKANLIEFEKEITWIDSINDLPKLPLIVIGNEFFDALPIKQYIKVKDRWWERILVTDNSDGHIKFSKGSISTIFEEQLNLEHINATDGAIFEESPLSQEYVKEISEHIHTHKGYGLFIDYGYDIKNSERTHWQYHPTLQAVKGHKYHPVLESLGEADLTAHVDFTALARIAEHFFAKTNKAITQKEFLLKYGLLARFLLLEKSATPEDKEILQKQFYRLTNKDQMGELFKVLEIYSEIS